MIFFIYWFKYYRYLHQINVCAVFISYGFTMSMVFIYLNFMIITNLNTKLINHRTSILIAVNVTSAPGSIATLYGNTALAQEKASPLVT